MDERISEREEKVSAKFIAQNKELEAKMEQIMTYNR